MTAILLPATIIFINTDLVPQVLGVFTRQLYITQTLDAATFDANVAADGYYIQNIHATGQRILVLRDLSDLTNRNLADIVLFAKAGLVSVLSNKYGPPGITLSIDRCYLTALINLQQVQLTNRERRLDLDDGFVGEFDNDDFNPFHMDPPIQRNVEPPDE